MRAVTLYFDFSQDFGEILCTFLLDKLNNLDYLHFILNGSRTIYIYLPSFLP
jgi:hypothetical protein